MIKRHKKDETNKKRAIFAVGTALGAVIGSAIALFSSPKSRKAARKAISKGYSKAANKGSKLVKGHATLLKKKAKSAVKRISKR